MKNKMDFGFVALTNSNLFNIGLHLRHSPLLNPQQLALKLAQSFHNQNNELSKSFLWL